MLNFFSKLTTLFSSWWKLFNAIIALQKHYWNGQLILLLFAFFLLSCPVVACQKNKWSAVESTTLRRVSESTTEYQKVSYSQSLWFPRKRNIYFSKACVDLIEILFLLHFLWLTTFLDLSQILWICRMLNTCTVYCIFLGDGKPQKYF